MGHGHGHSHGNLKVQAIAVGVGIILLLVKFTAWYITGSNAILADALESIINVIAGSLALFSIYYASRPRDAEHLYGHGKIEFISSAFEGVLIIGTGLVITGKAFYNFIYPQELEELHIGIILTSGAGLINFVLAFVLIRRGKASHSMAMEADGKHLLSDAYSTVGMLLGLVLVLITGKVWLDNAAAMLFGFLLLRIGYKVAKEALAAILGETDEMLVNQLVEILEKHRKPDWIDVHNLRIIKFGSELHVDCHFTLPWYYTIEQGHAIIDEIEELVNRETGRKTEFFIHIDPCRPHSCPICPKMDCEVRQRPFEKRLPWTLDKVLGLKYHSSHYKSTDSK